MFGQHDDTDDEVDDLNDHCMRITRKLEDRGGNAMADQRKLIIKIRAFEKVIADPFYFPDDVVLVPDAEREIDFFCQQLREDVQELLCESDEEQGEDADHGSGDTVLFRNSGNDGPVQPDHRKGEADIEQEHADEIQRNRLGRDPPRFPVGLQSKFQG